MRISKKMIEACQNAGACRKGLAWISAKPRTVEQLYEYNRNWFLWLDSILSPSTRDAYNAAMKAARDAYYAAVNSARDAYYAAMKAARDAYGAGYDAAVNSARDAYSAAEISARDAYSAAEISALIKALRKTFAWTAEQSRG